MQKHFYIAIALIALGCVMSVGFTETRAADISSSDAVDTAISQLEDKYFEHQYDSDTDVDRLNRLEDFIYGSHQSGSVNARVHRILSTILVNQNDQTVPVKQISQNASTKHSSFTANNKQTQVAKLPSTKPFDYGSYPHVTSLEQELLGHTYPTDSLQDRLKRLETKAYGAPSSSNDLSQRVDLLDDYAQRHDLYNDRSPAVSIAPSRLKFAPTTAITDSRPGQEPPTGSTYSSHIWPPNAQPEYTSGNGTFEGSAEERVSMMEAQEFHHTYPDKPLGDRLKKLEKKILPGQDIANLPPAQQTVQLWDTLHPSEKNQVATLVADASQSSETNPVTNSDQTSTSFGRRGSWLHKLANAGNSVTGTSMGPNSNMPTTYGTNMPFYGSGMPGYGNPNSRFIGASVGPGAGPAGLPVGFW